MLNPVGPIAAPPFMFGSGWTLSSSRWIDAKLPASKAAETSKNAVAGIS
jgi:hypothetical protein